MFHWPCAYLTGFLLTSKAEALPLTYRFKDIYNNNHTHSVSRFPLQCWHVQLLHYNHLYPVETDRRHEELFVRSFSVHF